MLNAKTGSSVNSCPIQAGKEAAAKVKAENIKLAFVYSGVQYNQKELLDSISAELPNVPLIGNTSFTGVITPEGFISGENGFVGIMAMADDELTVGIAGSVKCGTARETGKKVALEALKNAGIDTAKKFEKPDYFYMTAPPGEEEYYLKGIEEVIGRVPFFGGSAADNAIAGEWLLYTDKLVTPDGVAIALFYSSKPFANEFTGAYAETTKCGVITKVKNDRNLVEIDGVPALKKYAEWAGVDPDTLKGGALLAHSITAPLGVKDRLGDLVAIRHPMNGNDDYTINAGNNMAENTAIIYMESSVDELIKSTGVTLKALQRKMTGNAGAYHLVHCGGRRAGIDSRIDEVAAEIIKAAGGTPFIVEFTFGEYGYEDDGINTCGGLMLSFTGFGK